MHSISVIQDEHLYKMMFYIRKSFPKNDYVYIIFFITKFIPLLLFTHANFSITDSLFSISKMICLLINVVTVFLVLIILFTAVWIVQLEILVAYVRNALKLVIMK